MPSLKSTPPHWRSIEERDAPASASGSSPEFDEPAVAPSDEQRRRFLKVTGASAALAAAASGCRWEKDKLVPMAQRAEGTTPGVPRYFSTASEVGGVGVGLRVKSYDGRPIKVDGNPLHPGSRGSSSAWHQASLLELYDPDRSRGYAQRTPSGLAAATELEFRIAAKKLFDGFRKNSGVGLRVLSGYTTSVSREDMKRRFLAAFPEARWVEYEPISQYQVDAGARLAFGRHVQSHYDLSRARVIVSLDSDLLGARSGGLGLARQWAARRNPKAGGMNRLYAFEPRLTETGICADHRVPMRAQFIKALAAHIDAELSQRLSGAAGQPQPRPRAAFLDRPETAKVVKALLADLVANPAQSLVVAGPHQPAEVHALVHRLNHLLRNVGVSVRYHGPAREEQLSPAQELARLTEEMGQGVVSGLLILDANPVYTAPADIDFEGALSKVGQSISLSTYVDETAQRCRWHVPQAHPLESWGDVRGPGGVLSVQQPLIEPLHGGVSAIELLGALMRQPRKGREIVERALGLDPRLWRRSLHDGVVADSQATPAQVSLRPLPAFNFAEGELGDTSDSPLELVLHGSSAVYDGRFANNGWLQELPDPVTKLTWDNALLLSPKTAEEQGVKDGTWVTVEVQGRQLRLPAMVSPGQATGSLSLALGYGRTAAGRVGGQSFSDDPVPTVGVNAYRIRTRSSWHLARGVTLQPSSEKYVLATTQDKHPMDRIGQFGTQERLPMLVRETTLAQYEEHPDFAQHVVHHPKLLSLWQEPVAYEGHKWGMSIDLNKCTGCSGCVVACQAENNIPVVGREEVARGRELSWMRIDRYFSGDAENPRVVNQPVACMHCEHAPCEQVCPVGATMHSSEGLNDMTYNRCVGTRYCSNNCPYKVRRFNYFNYNKDLEEERNQVKSLALNPDVTVRFRGVMEKCSYCVQRIQGAKLDAKRDRRSLRDGDVTTACQDSCPTQAIVFGDLNDPQSAVARAKADSRDYALLEELNIRPRTTYLARVSNPRPEVT